MNKKLLASASVIISISVVFYAFSASGNEGWTKTELYFGFSKPDGGVVTNDEFRAFTDTVIAGVYYEGFSVIQARCGWLDPDMKQTIFEDSRIVICYGIMSSERSAGIDTIRAKYKRYFNQQAVMRVDQKADVSF